ncbi:MAG: uncharacterized protein KVP18_003817 [Porospora cf. gigantea A]|uniref:uncharacterized protein n=1 Tax=Porospora cf. gigantea A TaxID=2853593 RepID=UPI0035595DFF|nr:MAG: hypothetical protein KVP18_003817 [Porospora cf. gigantea A]
MAHKIGAAFHIPHGLANALLICNVVRFNATATPMKQTAFSQYSHPVAREQYADLATVLDLADSTDSIDEKIEKFLDWLEAMKTELNIPKSIQEFGGREGVHGPG